LWKIHKTLDVYCGFCVTQSTGFKSNTDSTQEKAPDGTHIHIPAFILF